MTIKWKIALVEDDRRLARAVATGLGDEGYTYLGVSSVLNTGTAHGALAFEVPQGYSQVSMQYQGFSTYSINWIRT